MTTVINNRITVGNVDVGDEKRLAVIALYDVDDEGNLIPVAINPLSREAKIVTKCREIVQRTLTEENVPSTIVSMDLRGITVAGSSFPQDFTTEKAAQAMKSLVVLLTTPQIIGQRMAEVTLIDQSRYATFDLEKRLALITSIVPKLQRGKRGELPDYTEDEQLFLNIFRSTHQGELSLQQEINQLYTMQLISDDVLQEADD